MRDKRVIGVIGGGAAGLSAAVMAARRGGAVRLFEKQPRVGRKLLATGNGTCNLSNLHASPEHYHGGDPGFVFPALRAFSPQDAMAFFASIGVPCTVRENGRIYPIVEQASAVLDALRFEAEALGVQMLTDTAVTAIVPRQDGVRLQTTVGAFDVSCVLVAVGGAASGRLGGSADGYRLLTAIGHEKTPLFPSIVQIKTAKDPVRPLKGLRLDAALTLCLDGKAAATSEGEVLFADYGLSGPAAMEIGRVAADWERRKQGHMTVSIDLLPGIVAPDLLDMLTKRRALPGRTLDRWLIGLLPKALGQTLLKVAGVQPLSRMADSVTDAELRVLTDIIKGGMLPVEGAAGMDAAQVTAGGVKTAGFDPATMRSRRCPFVYAAGEVLDIDGDCGGYNLQWAWASAHAAVTAMTEERT